MNPNPPSDAAAESAKSAARPARRYTDLRLLTDNDQAWQAKRQLIASARHTLDLSYFILEIDGSTSRLLLDLVEAAQRGVKVRLLVDYFLTFQQAPALRALAQIHNIEVRRYGPPTPGWLHALQAAGIDRDGFVRALMAADGAKLAEALQHNTIFAPAVSDELRALHAEAGQSAVGFPVQVVGALQSGAQAAPATSAADRAAGLHKVALVIEIVRGLKQYLHRTHHKLLLADGGRFIMGGRNLADVYQCTTPAQGRAFVDTDIVASDGHQGGSRHLDAFHALWNDVRTFDIATPDPLDSRPAIALDALRQKASPAAAISPHVRIELGTALPDMDGVLVDNLPGEMGDAAITRAYIEQIEQLTARGKPAVVDIVTAYLFLVDDASAGPSLLALRQALEAAARAGIAVNIYTNSLASTDLQPVNRAAYPKLIDLLTSGVKVFELSEGQGSLHTKCAAIGNEVLVVGSYNMDPRSELYDTNNLIILRDASGQATAAFRRLRVQGLKWDELTVDEARRLAAESKPAAGAGLVQGLL